MFEQKRRKYFEKTKNIKRMDTKGTKIKNQIKTQGMLK